MDKKLFDLNIVERAKREFAERERLANQKTEQYLKEEANADLMDMKKKRILQENMRTKAPSVVRKALLYSFINEAYERSLQRIPLEDYNGVRHNLINKYLNENDVSVIIRKFSTASDLLSETAYFINTHTKRILQEKVDNEEDVINVTIDDCQKNDFLDSLDNVTIDKIAEKVAAGVQQAQAEFLHYNERDKAHIEAIIDATQKKIDSTVKESLINLYEKDCKQAIHQVRCREKSIYEVMVNELCKQAYTNDVIGEQFLTENSNLDLDRITETAQVMYTFLELTNVMRLEEVNEEYIQKVYTELTGK